MDIKSKLITKKNPDWELQTSFNLFVKWVENYIL